MSQTAATTRRALRTLAHRAQVDWSKPYWTSTPAAAAQYNAVKAWVSMADAEAEKYSAPPGPVDFASAKKSIKDKELVDMLESFYASSKPAPETHEWPLEDKEHMDHHLAFLRDQSEFVAEAIPVLEKEAEFWKVTRTTVDTTMEEMCENHPTIHEEIENEIEAREWFVDTEFDKSSQSA